MADFVHLHNHTHYSLLDGACKIPDMVARAKKYGMPALAITDHGNMFGAIEFYQTCVKVGIKPIIGSEVYLAPKSRFDKEKDKKENATPAFHLVLLAKNLAGYKNLMKLVSKGYLEGFYYKPRIDHELLKEYADGLIAMSACLKGEIAHTLLNQNYDNAVAAVQKYQNIFGDDFYLEVQDHGISEEHKVADGFIKIAQETGTKVVATNDIHYLEKEHWQAHDVLLCLQTGKDLDDPNRMRYDTHELYFKSADEMTGLFKDHPEVIENTMDVTEKIDLELTFNDYHLPHYSIPENEESKTLTEYLRKLSYQGLRERYREMTPELENRLEFELKTISEMGYEGYFLITQDFINWAKDRNIPVGPGRGSAAGSLVSFCLGITDLDPIYYGLFFERFLNPERVSMPDIDIDFCYERREEVIRYVKEKYGHNSVCQIITFGTMAARGVVRDVGRVLKMSFGDVDKIAKLIPMQSKSLDDAIHTVQELREITEKDQQHQKLIEYSRVLEGLARHSSTHAAGVVIAPGELTDYIPLYKTKDDDITTQYEMKVLDACGMLKMDFLGLRTLTVIQRAVDAVNARGEHIDINNILMDDPEVFKIFCDGHTVGIFQFESSGMQEYMKKLKPNCIEDLIAINALYRPGPMANIDDYIDRKYGRKKIEYFHPLLKPILESTYGIIVFQEQVMQIASDLAGYSLGSADKLRRAMGKKKKEEMEKQRALFVDGCQKVNGIPENLAAEIFNYMEKFAEYGFNKSHAACYSIIAYQTGYLKAHFPAEFMAATISSEMNNSDRVTILIEEARRMGLSVLSPDVNESYSDFVVTETGLRFGLGAVKNVGQAAIKKVVKERKKGGHFKTLFDLVKRVGSSALNRKVLESLIEAGALDTVAGTRAQKFASVQTAIDFGLKVRQSDKANDQPTLFDMSENEEFEIAEPELEDTQDWSKSERLNREKEVLGFYLSGHPLDDYREHIHAFSTIRLEEAETLRDRTVVRVCGIIQSLKTHIDRKNRTMAFFKIEDFSGTLEGLAFADPYEQYKELLTVDSLVVISGKVNIREGADPKILVDEVLSLEEARKKYTKNLCLNVDTEKMSSTTLDALKIILQDNAGNVPVYFNVQVPEGNFMLKSRTLKVKPNIETIEKLREEIGRENVWIG